MNKSLWRCYGVDVCAKARQKYGGKIRSDKNGYKKIVYVRRRRSQQSLTGWGDIMYYIGFV